MSDGFSIFLREEWEGQSDGDLPLPTPETIEIFQAHNLQINPNTIWFSK